VEAAVKRAHQREVAVQRADLLLAFLALASGRNRVVAQARAIVKRKRMTGVHALLSDVAWRLGTGAPLDQDERALLSDLLLGIAAGEDVRKELRIEPPKVGHRKRDPLAPMIREAVQSYIDDAPPEKRKGRRAKAIRLIGELTGRGEEAINTVVKSAK
jgi:hypothetical protein